MRALFIFALFFLSLTTTGLANPSHYTIKILSWSRVDRSPNSQFNGTSEICGKISGPVTGQERMLLIVDQGRNQGEYISLVTPTGSFCHVVNSVNGRINITVEGDAAQDAIVSLSQFKN